MKKIAFTLCLSLLAAGTASAQYKMVVTKADKTVVEIKVDDVADVQFTDAANLAYSFADPVLREKAIGFDTNADGILSAEEIAAVEELDFSNTDIASLAGIENFAALKKLNVMSCKSLTAADLSALQNLEYIQMGYSGIENLVLGEKPVLTDIYAQYTPLKAIDLSNCKALERISIASTKVKFADFSACKNLKTLTAGSDDLTYINFDGCKELTRITVNCKAIKAFDCTNYPNLTDIDLSKCDLKEFSGAGATDLSSITLDHNPSLKVIDLRFNNNVFMLSALYCESLEKIILTEGQSIGFGMGYSDSIIEYVAREIPAEVSSVITDPAFKAAVIAAADTDGDGKVSADEAKALTVLSAPNAGIKEVDLFYFPALETLDLSGNELTSIDLSATQSITTLNLNNNKLTALDFSKLTSPQYIYASHNEISDLKHAPTYSYVEIDLSYNKITQFSQIFMNKLVKFDMSHNQLTTCVIYDDNSVLKELNVSYNQLTEMHLRTFKKMVKANLSNNPFSADIVTSYNNNFRIITWTELEELDLSNTDITAADVSYTSVLKSANFTGCEKLTEVYIGENAASTIIGVDADKIKTGSAPQN